MNRRDFVKGSVVAIAGVSCLSAGLKEAIALSKATSKPILTEEALNRIFATSAAQGRIKALAAEMFRDVRGWVKREFALNSLQERRLLSISDRDLAKIKKLLKLVEVNGGTLSVSFSVPPESVKFSHGEPAALPFRYDVGVKHESKEPDGTTKKTEVTMGFET